MAVSADSGISWSPVVYRATSIRLMASRALIRTYVVVGTAVGIGDGEGASVGNGDGRDDGCEDSVY